MRIHVEDLKFQTIIGILDFERETPQSVIVNLYLDYIYIENEFINYVEISELIKYTMIKEEFLLLEDALSHLSLKLKDKFPAIMKLQLKITKPSIMPDCKVSLSDSYTFNS
jgi:dihydroneopterin aldolase